MFQVLVSRTFQKQFNDIPNELHNRIKNGLKELKSDPYTPRANADIKQLNDTDPLKYRIRIGEYRVIYYIDGKVVKLIEVFVRGRGYRE
jgi:mRNA interferase RelE/StbE